MALMLAVLVAVMVTAPVAWHKLQTWMASRPAPRPATASEQHGIVHALTSSRLVTQLATRAQAPSPQALHLIVSDHTSLVCGGGPLSADHGNCVGLADWLQHGDPALTPQIPLRLRRELIGGNLHSIKLASLHSSTLQLATESGPPVNAYDPDWWEAFYRRHPGSDGLLRFSRAVLSKDRHTALIQVSHDCSEHDGSNKLVLLHWRTSQWHPDWWVSSEWSRPIRPDRFAPYPPRTDGLLVMEFIEPPSCPNAERHRQTAESRKRA